MNHTLNIHTRRCPQCGKEFIPTASWAYKNVKRKVLWCSWKCLREDEAGIPPHVPAKPKKPAPATNPPAQPLPVEVVAMAKESEPVKAPRKRETDPWKRSTSRTCPRGGKTWTLGKAAYERMQAGKTMRQIATELGVTLTYVSTAVCLYRNTERLPCISNAERIQRANKVMAEKKMRNLSGEKTARLAACIHRIHALLAEIREEVGVGA